MMLWNKKKGNEKTLDERTKRSMEIAAFAKDIIKPHLEKGMQMTEEDAKEYITTLFMALSFGSAVLAHKFLKSDPKEFSTYIAEYIEEVMEILAKKSPKGGKNGSDAEDKETWGPVN